MRNEKVWGVKHGEKTKNTFFQLQHREDRWPPGPFARYHFWPKQLLARSFHYFWPKHFDPLILPLLARPLLAQTTSGPDNFWPAHFTTFGPNILTRSFCHYWPDHSWPRQLLAQTTFGPSLDLQKPKQARSRFHHFWPNNFWAVSGLCKSGAPIGGAGPQRVGPEISIFFPLRPQFFLSSLSWWSFR